MITIDEVVHISDRLQDDLGRLVESAAMTWGVGAPQHRQAAAWVQRAVESVRESGQVLALRGEVEAGQRSRGVATFRYRESVPEDVATRRIRLEDVKTAKRGQR